MAFSIEATGKTVEAAYEAALKELGAARENTELEVIAEPKKALFGLFGGTDAKVRVTLKEISPIDAAENFLQNIFRHMQLDVTISITDGEEVTTFSLVGDNLGLIIGKHGQTLDSLQYLTNLAANRGLNENRRRIFLDIEGYRDRREDTLKRLAFRLAEKARRTGEKIMLEPMNCHERKIIHLALQDDYRVKTYSYGDEPHRKVVIEPKPFSRSNGRYDDNGEMTYSRRSYNGGRGYGSRYDNGGKYGKSRYADEQSDGSPKGENGEGAYEESRYNQEANDGGSENSRYGRNGYGSRGYGHSSRGYGSRGGKFGGRNRRYERSPYTDPNYEPDFSMFNEHRETAAEAAAPVADAPEAEDKRELAATPAESFAAKEGQEI